MDNRYYFIGGFPMEILVSESLPKLDDLLPSFRGFEASEPEPLSPLHVSMLPAHEVSRPASAKLLDETTNILGTTQFYSCDEGYYAECQFGNTSKQHCMVIDKGMDRATMGLDVSDPCVATCATTLMQLFFSLAIVKMKAVMLHASVVKVGTEGYVFLGKSGTGKSTHSRMWLQAIAGSELLNDDNPIVRRLNNSTRYEVWGTPWSGKTPCYVNKHCEVAGIVRLEQAPQNEITRLDPMEAYVAMLPSCSMINSDEAMLDRCNDTLIALAEDVKVARLRCLPNREAALLCYEKLSS